MGRHPKILRSKGAHIFGTLSDRGFEETRLQVWAKFTNRYFQSSTVFKLRKRWLTYDKKVWVVRRWVQTTTKYYNIDYDS